MTLTMPTMMTQRTSAAASIASKLSQPLSRWERCQTSCLMAPQKKSKPLAWALKL